MTEADLTRIESAVGRRLPSFYRDFLREHSETLRGVVTRCDRVAVLDYEADRIIDRHARIAVHPKGLRFDEDRVPWLPKLLLIGASGGDHWCINLDSDRPRVWEFKHEGGYLVPAGFADWDEYLASLEESVAYWEGRRKPTGKRTSKRKREQ